MRITGVWCNIVGRVSEDLSKGINEIVRNHRCPPTGWYELVVGPVAAFWTQRVAMNGADQISFHENGIKVLNDLIDEGKSKGPNGRGDPDYYQWSPLP